MYKILRQALGGKLSSDDQFAIIALIDEPSFKPADQEEEPPSCECRPNHPTPIHTRTHILTFKTLFSAESEVPENGNGGEPTDDENQAGTSPQAGAKGHSLRQNASQPGGSSIQT